MPTGSEQNSELVIDPAKEHALSAESKNPIVSAYLQGNMANRSCQLAQATRNREFQLLEERDNVPQPSL